MTAQLLLVLDHLTVNKIIYTVTSRTGDKKDEKDNEIDQREFTFWHHTVMYFKECNRHRNNHRYKNDTGQHSHHQEDRAGKFTENRQHECGIATQTEDARICD